MSDDLLSNPPAHTTALCPHFGSCGGCQYQDVAYPAQLQTKRHRLEEFLRASVTQALPEISIHSAEPYHYRNRIRLRSERIAGELRFGYNIRATTDFLPITTCPIAAPVLWQTAEALLQTAPHNLDASAWLDAANEVELFCDDALQRVQVTLLCPPRTSLPRGSFLHMMQAAQETFAGIAGASAIAVDPRTGPTGRVFDTFGAPGLNYRVLDETYWISRGAFFQINRFLLPTLLYLVTRQRSGHLAWDLFSGVGLFSRVLARNFTQVVGVEANPIAVADLRNALARIGKQHSAVEATTLNFLREATMQRDRPDLIVLDPPRAGAGIEACELMVRLTPQQIVYVSCDPDTLARDLGILQTVYNITELHLLDLFPQTPHIETVVVLKRNS